MLHSIDIENEYVEFGRRLGFSCSEIDTNIQLGMDPFNYMTPYRAATLLADVLGVDKLTKYSMLKAAEDNQCTSVDSMIGLMKKSDHKNETNHYSYMQILEV